MNNTKPLLTILGVIVAGLIGYFIGNNSGMNTMHSQMDMDHDMGSMMMDMNANLRGKTGDAFDKAFIDEMIVHHEGAVDMAKLVLETSKRPELVQLANDIIAAQTKEIDMMKSWRSAWFTK